MILWLSMKEVAAIILAGDIPPVWEISSLYLNWVLQLCHRACRALFLQAGVCDVRVVAGYRAEEVAEVAKDARCYCHLQPQF